MMDDPLALFSVFHLCLHFSPIYLQLKNASWSIPRSILTQYNYTVIAAVLSDLKNGKS